MLRFVAGGSDFVLRCFVGWADDCGGGCNGKEVSMWSPEYHRDDVAQRCYQTCGAFKLVRWCGKTDFVGVCTEGHTPNDTHCEFWKSDGFSIDPNIRNGNELLLFPKQTI